MELPDCAAFLASLSLSHVALDAATVADLLTVLNTSGRPALLSHLRTAGVQKLADRQKIANRLGRAQRDGFFSVPEEETYSSSSESGGAFAFDPYQYAEVIVPADRAVKGRPRRPRDMGSIDKHLVLGTPLLPLPAAAASPSTLQRAIFAAGCFCAWLRCLCFSCLAFADVPASL